MYPPTLLRASLAVAVTLGLAACGSDESASTVSVSNCGQDVELPTDIERVFTIGQGAIEFLDAVGVSDRVVARSGEFGSPLPDSVDAPPSDDLIVDPFDPTAEAIIAADPDIVYGYGLFNATPEQLEQAGIAMLTVSGECGHDAGSEVADPSFATVSEELRMLGELFGTAERAEQRADEIDARVAELAGPDRGLDAAWVYFFSEAESMSAYGGAGMFDHLLDTAGLGNVFAEQNDTYLSISAEALIDADPDWVIMTYGFSGETADEAEQRLRATPGLAEVDAIAADRIVLVPVSGATPGAVDLLETVVHALDG